MTLGFSFSETMAGPFVLGETDPREGEARGRREGSELEIRVAVEIGDLDRFLADAEHQGDLSGEIDLTPWDPGIAAPRGVFNLFAPAAEPRLKLMVYELAFVHGGEAWYLAGKKEVRDDPGFDLWSDTTILYTRLHRGPDASGEVAGAGVLTLGVADLARLVSTMAVPGAGSAAEKARALTRFGSFFLGELWDSYVHPTSRERSDP